MRLLLDTHVLLWLMESSPRLNAEARRLIVTASDVYVSSVSILEIAVKFAIGKIEEDPEAVIGSLDAAGLRSLEVTHRHAATVAKLPLLHRDPFDRLLIAQAISEPLRLLSADAQLSVYSDLVIRI